MLLPMIQYKETSSAEDILGPLPEKPETHNNSVMECNPDQGFQFIFVSRGASAQFGYGFSFIDSPWGKIKVMAVGMGTT